MFPCVRLPASLHKENAASVVSVQHRPSPRTIPKSGSGPKTHRQIDYGKQRYEDAEILQTAGQLAGVFLSLEV